MAGIYIHIPFCVKKCCYCDFVSFPEEGRTERYVDTLIREIDIASKKLPVPDRIDTVFVGGGTPSLLSGEQFSRIMQAVRTHYPLASDAECSIECNPGTVTGQKMLQFRLAGANRISIGAQSTDPALLSAIGRIHTRDQIFECVRFAVDAGFKNINMDVMHGLPSQTSAKYLETLDEISALPITHISAYSLILEEGTPLFLSVQEGAAELPNADAVADMQDAGLSFLAKSRFHRYEISNFALDGFACRNNLNYWDNGEYLGFGLAAHGALFLPDRRGRKQWTRYENTTDLKQYFMRVDGGRLPDVQRIRLFQSDEMFECIMLGLRKTEGLSEDAFLSRFGVPIQSAFPKACVALAQNGWLAEKKTRFALNDTGLDFQNAALQLFM